MYRRGALLNFAMQNLGGQIPIHSYTDYAWVSDLVMLLCCTELTYWIYLGTSHEVTFNLIPNCKESCYGQISIEIATYSLGSHSLTLNKFWSPLWHTEKNAPPPLTTRTILVPPPSQTDGPLPVLSYSHNYIPYQAYGLCRVNFNLKHLRSFYALYIIIVYWWKCPLQQ